VATLEPLGMGEGDKQVDNEDYATYQFDPVLGAQHRVPPGVGKRTDTSRRPGFPAHLEVRLVLSDRRR
jgi:hypothetical protein